MAKRSWCACSTYEACRYDPKPADRPMHRLDHNGQVVLGGEVWSVEDVGLPGPELELLVYGQGQLRGRFVLTPTPGQPISLQRRVVAVSIADQVGAALQPRLRSASSTSAAEASLTSDSFGDAIADFLVDVAPVVQGAFEDGLGHTIAEVADHIRDQTVTSRIVHDLSDQRAGLTPIIIFGMQ